jgi:uncharacterized phage protein gp47/JayE
MSLSAVITPAGVTAPSFADVLAGLQAAVRAIYGSDIYIAPDSKDGQFLALLAQAISDANAAAIAVRADFAPGSAQGAGLSSVVKVNGLARLVASYSTAVGLVVGQVGTVINNGTVKDANGNLWNLPSVVTIPPAGQISVTVTAQQLGALAAGAGTINAIATPVLGWQTFASTSDAAPGAPVETDAALRQRQSLSTSLPAQTPLAALLAALSNLPGVIAVKVYENATGATDANGIPARNICVVIEGGNLATIAQTIGQKKTPGAGTYGTTSQVYVDAVTGITYTINFYVLAFTTVKVKILGTALPGYTSATSAAIQAAVSAYLATHGIGETVEYSGLWAPAYLNGPARLQPYKITTLQLSTDGGTTWVTTDAVIAFNKIVANVAATDVLVTIT